MEHVKPIAWIPVVTCLLGLGLLSYDGSVSMFRLAVWEALAVAGSLLSGIAVVNVRKLASTLTRYSPRSVSSAPGWPSCLQISQRIGLIGGVFLLSIGLIATVAQIMMTWAYGKIDVSTGSLLSMLMSAFNVIIGLAFFHEAQNAIGIVGMFVVIISCAGIVFINRRAVSVPTK